VRTGLEEVHLNVADYPHTNKKSAMKAPHVPAIDLNNIKESPMIIDDSQASPTDKNQQFAEYDYHSAEKGGQAPAIETSMQSYSRGIGRHLGSAQKKKKDDRNVDTDESHDKDDIVTNGYA
jgi:hypothetical protein